MRWFFSKVWSFATKLKIPLLIVVAVGALMATPYLFFSDKGTHGVGEKRTAVILTDKSKVFTPEVSAELTRAIAELREGLKELQAAKASTSKGWKASDVTSLFVGLDMRTLAAIVAFGLAIFFAAVRDKYKPAAVFGLIGAAILFLPAILSGELVQYVYDRVSEGPDFWNMEPTTPGFVRSILNAELTTWAKLAAFALTVAAIYLVFKGKPYPGLVVGAVAGVLLVISDPSALGKFENWSPSLPFQTARAMANDCPGNSFTQTYGSEKAVVNGKFCQLRGEVLNGCVTWFNSRGDKLAHSCQGDIPSVRGIHSVKADSSARIAFNHCPPGSPGTLLERCN